MSVHKVCASVCVSGGGGTCQVTEISHCNIANKRIGPLNSLEYILQLSNKGESCGFKYIRMIFILQYGFFSCTTSNVTSLRGISIPIAFKFS